MKRDRTLTQYVWNEMKARCANKNHKSYKNYGGRGITVCDRWESSFQDFVEDMGLKPSGFSLERIDNNKGYYPENCTWIPRNMQSKNRRYCRYYRTKTRRYCLKDLWRKFAHDSVTYRRLCTRLDRDGWGIIRALIEPTGLGKNHFGIKGNQGRTTA